MVDLKNPDQIKKQVVDIVSHWLAPEARALVNEFEKANLEGLKSTNSELYNAYKQWETLLRLVAIPALPNGEVWDLLKNSAIQGFSNEIDLLERITLKLYAIPELVRKDFKTGAIKALSQNEQRLGSKLIKDWLADYNQAAGGKKHNNVERSEYMAKSKDVQTLPEADKNLLGKILTLYDELKVEIVQNAKMPPAPPVKKEAPRPAMPVPPRPKFRSL